MKQPITMVGITDRGVQKTVVVTHCPREFTNDCGALFVADAQLVLQSHSGYDLEQLWAVMRLAGWEFDIVAAEVKDSVPVVF